MGVEDHRAAAAGAPAARCAVVTVSDSRTPATDASGDLAQRRFEEAGHVVVYRVLVPNDPEPVQQALFAALEAGSDLVLFVGGTGLSRRDRTLDVVAPFFEKSLDGFGELFRYLSFGEVGAAAMLSRAAAGTVRDSLVFCLPGSPAAVRLALERLVLPELAHLLRELRR
ncbi:MAG: MogA/MoaB family molybdenum cofactor biosynthesis protein [Clostridia bacterium]|nr:MogA/MoaB family molybdenum cofactor biosynthesis protein [Clostridia bacterium]